MESYTWDYKENWACELEACELELEAEGWDWEGRVVYITMLLNHMWNTCNLFTLYKQNSNEGTSIKILWKNGISEFLHGNWTGHRNI